MSLGRRLAVLFEMVLGLILTLMGKYDIAQIALLFAILMCVVPSAREDEDMHEGVWEERKDHVHE